MSITAIGAHLNHSQVVDDRYNSSKDF